MADRHQRIWQRMRTAVRDRDWFGVSIEVLVVVLGVLLAMQANHWAQNARDAAERAALVDRLIVDLEAYAEENEAVAEARSRRLERIVWIEEMQGQGTLAQADPQKLAAAIDAVFSYDDVRSLPLTFTEMVSSGSLARLDDPEARRALERLSRIHARNIETVELFHGHIIDHWDFANAAYAFKASRYLDESDPGESRGQVDLAMLDDVEFGETLRDAAQRDGFLRSFDRGTAEAARRAVAELRGN